MVAFRLCVETLHTSDLALPVTLNTSLSHFEASELVKGATPKEPFLSTDRMFGCLPSGSGNLQLDLENNHSSTQVDELIPFLIAVNGCLALLIFSEGS